MTILVDTEIVVQFRPKQYRLDLEVADAARRVYGKFAPETKELTTIISSGLVVYRMERIKGISYSDFRDLGQPGSYRAVLCREFALFMSCSWRNRHGATDLPLARVGKSLAFRLKALCMNLPARFQPRAHYLLEHIHDVESLPWVLTHGDIIAANIMVNSANGELQGLVDWAEAERLPFGICFYGLEEILGEMSPTGFRYCSNASELREIFWTELVKCIPELRDDATLRAVKLSRDLGILLWYGIAFDNGNIDRVVQEGRDVEEIQKLDAFLGSSLEKVVRIQSKL